MLGKAKVMSYEDIVAARQRRTDQENGTKRKRSLRRKGQVRRVCKIDAGAEGAQVDTTERVDVPLEVVEARFEDNHPAPCPGRAPVAQM